MPGSLSNCTADTRVVTEATAGVWFKVLDGSKEKLNWGRIQFGPQYSVVIRNAWSGAGYSERGTRHRQHVAHIVPLLPSVRGSET